jgi:hypothetical protein
MQKIYLACPYTHPEQSIRWMRFELANKAAGRLMQQGNIVFSPISMSHPIACVCSLPAEWDFWERHDRPFLDWADSIHVLCLGGWLESTGVQAEIEYARAMGKPIVYEYQEVQE